MIGALAILAGLVIFILGVRGTYKLFPPWQNVGKLSSDVSNTVKVLSSTTV